MMYKLAVIVGGMLLMLFILMPMYIWCKRKQLRDKHHNNAVTLTIKGAATAVAVVYCATAMYTYYNNADKIYPEWFTTNPLILIGLIICMAADVVLGIKFIIGMGLFFLGHICYITYFIVIGGFNPVSFLIFIPLGALLFLYFRKRRDKVDKNQVWAYYGYGLTILATFSIGIMLPFSIGEAGMFPAIGAAMLVVSDYMLAYLLLVKMTPLADAISLGFYYGGQFMMAMSVFIPVYILA